MLGFIIAIGAGFATPHIQEPVAEPLAKALAPHMTIEPTEMRALAFMIAMLIATIVIAFVGSGSPFWVMLGGVLGYFGTRIFEAGKNAFDGKSEDADEE